jgi:hypothetical protein
MNASLISRAKFGGRGWPSEVGIRVDIDKHPV